MNYRKSKYQIIDATTARLELTKGYWALVDVSLLPLLLNYSWAAAVKGKWIYAKTQVPSGSVYMHEIVFGKLVRPKGTRIDHINQNSLDNRKSNLRLISHANNLRNAGPQAHNTTGVRGVTFDRNRGKYLAQIKINGVHKFLGRFDVLEQAQEAYEKARQELLH